MIRTVVVEGKQLIRAALVKLLEESKGIEVVNQADDSQAAIDSVRELLPDVVVMDVHMPALGGLETARRILRAHPDVGIVALSGIDDESYASWLLQAGVLGCLSKCVSPAELVSAIRRVHIGQRYLSLDIAQKLALSRFDGQDSNPFTMLSCRELEIALMVVNCRRVRQISNLLCLSSKTVNSYRYRIFDKLNISSDVELTHLAVRYQMLEIASPS